MQEDFPVRSSPRSGIGLTASPPAQPSKVLRQLPWHCGRRELSPYPALKPWNLLETARPGNPHRVRGADQAVPQVIGRGHVLPDVAGVSLLSKVVTASMLEP